MTRGSRRRQPTADAWLLAHAKEILGEVAALDAAEDALYGDGRGDDLPPGFRNSGDRTRLREAKQALEAQSAARAKKVPRDRGGACGSAAGVFMGIGRWSVA
jgi:hypothetical protein